MQLVDIPQGWLPVQCRGCHGLVALPIDDITPQLVRQVLADHAELCPGPPQAPPDLRCTMGGARHCHCATETGECCWCGADVETT
jgi:hypothetical protein